MNNSTLSTLNSKLSTLFSLFLTACGTASLSVTNPVIDADAPDPTVIRVGDTYYAAATSGNNPQAYVRYQSKDLKSWQRTGYVFDQWPEWTKGAFWAPEFFVIGNKVMCYYTARQKSDGTSCIGLASAEGPEGKFVDHGPFVRTTNEAIDAFVFNDNGQLYITWKAYGLDPSGRPIEILTQRLTADGMHFEGEPFMLLRDDERQGMEGQCIFREGKYYYMLYSIRDCCTPQSDYAVSVARSEKFTGPWEKFPYYLCHAYYLNRYKEGRKAILQHMSMGKDLWPTFGSPGTVKAQSRLKVKR